MITENYHQPAGGDYSRHPDLSSVTKREQITCTHRFSCSKSLARQNQLTLVLAQTGTLEIIEEQDPTKYSVPKSIWEPSEYGPKAIGMLRAPWPLEQGLQEGKLEEKSG